MTSTTVEAADGDPLVTVIVAAVLLAGLLHASSPAWGLLGDMIAHPQAMGAMPIDVQYLSMLLEQLGPLVFVGLLWLRRHRLAREWTRSCRSRRAGGRALLIGTAVLGLAALIFAAGHMIRFAAVAIGVGSIQEAWESMSSQFLFTSATRHRGLFSAPFLAIAGPLLMFRPRWVAYRWRRHERRRRARLVLLAS